MSQRDKQLHGPFAKKAPDFGTWIAIDQKEGTLCEGAPVQVGAVSEVYAVSERRWYQFKSVCEDVCELERDREGKQKLEPS